MQRQATCNNAMHDKEHHDMQIGHLRMTPMDGGSDAAFVRLVTALRHVGVDQYVMYHGAIADIDGVTLWSSVDSPVVACCLMPGIDVAHAHDPFSGRAGLLLTLTRAIPYVLTHRGAIVADTSALQRAVYRRAAAVICQDDSEVAMLRHWIPGIPATVMPDTEHMRSIGHFVELYQNSQRTPIAGSNGNQ